MSISSRKQLDTFLCPDTAVLTSTEKWGGKYQSLSEALGRVLDDYSLVKFFPLDITNEENVQDLLTLIDNSIQYGEDLDVKTRDFDYPDNDGEEDPESFEKG